MKQYWHRFAAKIDTRNQRERALIFVMLIVVLLVLVNALFFDPLVAKMKRLGQEIGQQHQQLADTATKIQVTESGGPSDPDAPARVRLAVVEQKLAQTAAALQSTQQSLVAPDKMARVLEDMLTQNHNLKLVALKTLPVSGVLDTPESKPATDKPAKAAGPSIYKHGVEITVSGSYADLTQYLDALEKLPWHMFWGKAEMRVEEYPRVTLTITLYTLSMEKTWLSV